MICLKNKLVKSNFEKLEKNWLFCELIEINNEKGYCRAFGRG